MGIEKVSVSANVVMLKALHKWLRFSCWGLIILEMPSVLYGKYRIYMTWELTITIANMKTKKGEMCSKAFLGGT